MQTMDNIVTCWYCGTFGSTDEQNNVVRFFHDECREKYESEKQERLNKYISLKVQVMHERALRLLEKQNVNIEEYYDESIAVCEKALEEPNKFLSSHEMIAAMELLRNEIRFKKEHKILNHRVDFLIPRYKVVLEIDGHLHSYKKISDSKRDIAILNVLNKEDSGWEVVRIPTKRIEQNVQKLIPAIITISNYKREQRAKNGGLLPSNFSSRDKEYYEMIVGN